VAEDVRGLSKSIGADVLLVVEVVAIVVAFLVLAVVLLTLLDAAVEAVRLRLQKKRKLRQRFWRH
jgi:hypothetical protein